MRIYYVNASNTIPISANSDKEEKWYREAFCSVPASVFD